MTVIDKNKRLLKRNSAKQKRICYYDDIMTDVDVKKLAELARVEVSGEEMEALKKEIPAILSFVEQVQEAHGASTKALSKHRNIMREDAPTVGGAHESGVFTKDMIEAMPSSKDGYLKVRKIIQQD
jgi:aspartyl-tRNA(Asn)/glutamyl-tRNA(Gln) amidotransferase subunit C